MAVEEGEKGKPKTVEEAVDYLLSSMLMEEKKIVKETQFIELIKFHHGWGTNIRNELGLWGDNHELMKACGKIHPDDASMVVIEAVWKRLNSDEDKIENIEEKEEKSIPLKEGECQYYWCEKGISELFECRHCKELFCKEHVPPKKPQVINIKNATPAELENRRKPGHPCPPYVEHYAKEQDEKKNRYWHKLNILLSTPSKKSWLKGRTEIKSNYGSEVDSSANSLAPIIFIILITGFLIYSIQAGWFNDEMGIETKIIQTERPGIVVQTTLPPSTTSPPPKIRPAFDEFILEAYPNLREYNSLLQIKDDTVIKVPEDLARYYFSSEDETIKAKADEWGIGAKTFKGNLANMINWARAKTNYDFEKAEGNNPEFQTAGETLETGMGICGDQARLMAGLLYNAGYTNVTLISADCTSEYLDGLHGFVLLYYEGDEYYIDLTSWRSPFDSATARFYEIKCENVYEVMTPTMLISDYL